MNAMYVERLPGVATSEDDAPANEGNGWYNTEVHSYYATASNSYTNLSSFNGVLLEQVTETIDHHIDPQVEEVYVSVAEDAKPNTNGIKATATKEYTCNMCTAVFNNSSNLKSHQRTHTGERPYVCSICLAAFVQSSNLKAHRRIHTGERPYVCTECGQAFSRSSHLTGHKRTHTGEKPYICGICKANFTTSTHLRNHMRKHTGEKPYSCSLCAMTFNQNSSLQNHLLVHTGERPFKCSQCEGAFRSKRDLWSHIRLHSTVKPYSCNTCAKHFKTNQYLQKHLKKCAGVVICKRKGRPRKDYEKYSIEAEENETEKISLEQTTSEDSISLSHEDYEADHPTEVHEYLQEEF